MEEDSYINTKNNQCIICKEQKLFKNAAFGLLLDKKRTHCCKHKTEAMINLNDIHRGCQICQDEGVFKIASFGFLSGKIHCRGCLGFVKKKENKRGLKEQKIVNVLTNLSKEVGVPVRDHQISNGCSKKRPDFYYKDFNDCFSLIIEVDENQHSRYTCGVQAELQRMINIYENDNGGSPLCIIRFNPDPYYYKEKAISSYKGREQTLIDTIKGLKNRRDFNYKIGVIYLYYDQFTTCRIEELDYEYEDGKLLVNHKHPHIQDRNHSFLLT